MFLQPSIAVFDKIYFTIRTLVNANKTGEIYFEISNVASFWIGLYEQGLWCQLPFIVGGYVFVQESYALDFSVKTPLVALFGICN